MKKCILLSLTMVGMGWTSAIAQVLFNPNVLPLGENEALMGNTGIGGVNSPAAVYYNPGALAMLEGHSVSLSATAFTRYGFGANPISDFGGSEIDFEATGFRSLPTSIVMVRKLGEWRVGGFVLFTSDFAYEGQEFWEVQIPSGPLEIRSKINYRETLAQFGAAAARPFGNGWMLGVSISALNFSYLNAIDFYASLSNVGDFFFFENIRDRISATGLLLSIGGLKTWDRWNLGLRITAPGLDVFKGGESYAFQYELTPGNSEPQLSESRFTDLEGRYKSPLEVGIGTVYHPDEVWMFAADLTFRTGVDYRVYENLEGAERIRTKPNVRVNGGVQFRPGERFAYHLGASYSPPTLEEDDFDAGLQVIGAYGGVKLFTEHLETTLGFFFAEGTGDASLQDSDLTSRRAYEFLGLFVGSSYRF